MKNLKRSLLLVFATFLLIGHAHRSLAMDSMGGMNMDSAGASSAGSTANDDGDSTSGKLTLVVTNGDSVWNVQATFIGPDSTGKIGPLAGQTVHFYVQRLFGIMPVRDDDNTAATDETGTAAIQMPKNIPGDVHGNVVLLARVEDDDRTGPVAARDTGSWGKIVPVVADPFPRALWEPNAPIAMILTFTILFGGVWATYGFVVTQLVTIKKDKHNES